MFDFYARLTHLWNNLPVETGPVIEVEGTTFRYPKETPFIKGTLQHTNGALFNFMSFAVGVHTYEKDALLNSQPSVVSFIQTSPDQWVFTISEKSTHGTVAFPMLCCSHTIDLAERLSIGESSETHMLDADGTQVTIEMKPLELLMN